jgi:hypothetical protein
LHQGGANEECHLANLHCPLANAKGFWQMGKVILHARMMTQLARMMTKLASMMIMQI